MFDDWCVALAQNLVASAVWATGATMTRAARYQGADVEERLGPFTAQIMDTDAIVGVVADNLPASGSSEQAKLVLNQPELQSVVHELLTVRLLEQHEEAERLRDGMRTLTKTICESLTADEAVDLADHLFDWLDSACCSVTQSLDAAEPTVRASIQQLAGLSSLDLTIKRIAQTIEAIELRTLSVRRDEEAYLSAYRKIAARRHGDIVLPDVDIERRIPVRDIYVAPQIMIRRNSANPADQDSISDPVELALGFRRTVLLGQPGGGKSTLSGVLMHRLAQESGLVPFLVTLRKYGKDYEEKLSFIQHIERTLNADYQQEPPLGWVEQTMASGNALVIFDGLDELLNPSRRREIRDAVDAFSQTYPFARVLVTSRLVGYDQAPLPEPDFATADLGEFAFDSVHEYVANWFSKVATGLTPAERERRVESFLLESESVHDLRSNPLLLSLMCVLYRGINYIPESRLSLYDECAKLLFRKWDRSRDINVALEIGSDIDASLMHLALWMLEQDVVEEGVAESRLIRECAANLVPRRYEHLEDALRVSEEFVHFCRDRAWVLAEAGVSSTGERLFTFTHRTFLEYYAASQLARLEGTPELMAGRLASRIAASEWEVIGQLGLLIANRNHDSGAERFLNTLIQTAESGVGTDATSRTLQFASRSLQYATPSPRFIRSLTQRVFEWTINADWREEVQGRNPWQLSSSAFAFLVSAPMPTLRTVADELRGLVRQYLENRATLPTSVNSYVVALACYVRVAGTHYNIGPAPRDVDPYVFWAEWSVDVLAGFTWASEYYESRIADAGLGAVEFMRLDLKGFLQTFSLGDLWEGLTLAPLRGRVGTLPLLDGWLREEFMWSVFIPEAPDFILRSLSEVAATPGLFPVSLEGAGPMGPTLRRGSQSRYELLSSEGLRGAVLLRCMAEERMHLESRVLPPEVSDGARKGPAVHAVEKLVDALLATRMQSAGSPSTLPQEALQLWESFDLELREMLTSWSTGTFSFWEGEPDPMRGTSPDA